MIWLKLKAWGWAIGAGLLAALAAMTGIYRHKAIKYERKADTLKATVNAERVRKEIEKKEEEKLSLKESEIKKEVKKDEHFKGVDNLTNSNDW